MAKAGSLGPATLGQGWLHAHGDFATSSRGRLRPLAGRDVLQRSLYSPPWCSYHPTAAVAALTYAQQCRSQPCAAVVNQVLQHGDAHPLALLSKDLFHKLAQLCREAVAQAR